MHECAPSKFQQNTCRGTVQASGAHCIPSELGRIFRQVRIKSISGKIDLAIQQRRERESKSTGEITLHGTCTVGTFLCFEHGNHFRECHALSGVALPTSSNHLPHAIRKLRVFRPIRQATIQYRIHSRDDAPVGVRGFPTKNLKSPIPSKSAIRGCEFYSYLPNQSGKRE